LTGLMETIMALGGMGTCWELDDVVEGEGVDKGRDWLLVVAGKEMGGLILVVVGKDKGELGGVVSLMGVGGLEL
ncbi:hypothetical protein A2U01_0035621, partial [Trifolium medium]|nr:hypothetical protein [Trifolium medium]